MKGVILLSGGMDSTTLLFHLLRQNYELYPVVFNYGQLHRVAENKAAEDIWKYCAENFFGAQLYPIKYIVFDLTQIGGSALTDSRVNVPDNMADQVKTVVPHRNGLMTTLAAAYGETVGVYDIFLTPVKDDYLSYPDCRPATMKALSTFLSLSATNQPADVTVHTPFINMWKKDVVTMGFTLQVPFELTHSCYKGLRPACGKCPACRERYDAFRINGLTDPLEYSEIPEALVV